MAEVKDYIRPGRLPHIWCAGCGDGTIAAALIRVIDKLKLDKDKLMIVTGIGCSSRFNNIIDCHSFQTLHGRTFPFATGIKMVRPDMKVIVIPGDGDGTAIGGNHLIHTARRNLDMTTILINNSIFGMTGGQFSPLTPHGAIATTARYENPEYPFDTCKLVEGAGATYVARSTVYHISLTEKLIERALTHKGFSYVEIISQCPTNYGKRNKMANPYDMLMWQKEHSVTVEQASKLSQEEIGEKYLIGELCVRTDRKEFIQSYDELRQRAQSKNKGGAGK